MEIMDSRSSLSLYSSDKNKIQAMGISIKFSEILKFLETFTRRVKFYSLTRFDRMIERGEGKSHFSVHFPNMHVQQHA